MTESFGAMLKRLREARTITGSPWPGTSSRSVVGRVLSQNELAARAGVDSALVWRIEAGLYTCQPRRETVERLVEGLELDNAERARLMIAAGYWPWDLMADADIVAIVDAVVWGRRAG